MSRVTLEKKSLADKNISRPVGIKQDYKKIGSDDNRSNANERFMDAGKESFAHYGSYHREITYENTYKLEPDSDHKFDGDVIDKIVSNLLNIELKDAVYTSEFAQKMSLNLTGKIMDDIKELKLKQYKLVVVVNIGNSRDKPSVHLFSRCLWSSTTDSYSSITFTNNTIYAVAMIFGVYFE